MDELDNAPEPGGDEAIVNSVLDKLGDFDDEGAAVETKESEGAKPEEGGPEEVTAEEQSEEEEGQGDPATVIAPPDSWPAEHRAKFSQLPSDLQAVIAARETEQKSAFNRQINEAAETKKAVETERQRLAQTLNTFIQLSNTLDPIIAEGDQTDWVKFSNEDPALAQTKWFAYQQRKAQVNAAIQERQRIADEQTREHLATQKAALSEKLPEWKDEAKQKAIKDEVLSTLTSRYGFTRDELKGLSDHRTFLVARDAALYHKLMAERKSVADKKVVVIPKVQKPGAGTENVSSSERFKAMKQRAAKTENLHDRAALIAAALD